MAKVLQHRRGTTSEHSSFTGAEGELTVDTTEKRVVVHDGSTVGGIPMARTKAPNDMLHNTNEFTFIPSEYAGEVYINHRTASGYHTGAISNYHFCNGSGGYTTVIANYFKGKFQGATDRPEYNGSQVAMLSDVTVSSVNGQTGAVTVDVGVTSVNGTTADANGNVTIEAGAKFTVRATFTEECEYKGSVTRTISGLTPGSLICYKIEQAPDNQASATVLRLAWTGVIGTMGTGAGAWVEGTSVTVTLSNPSTTKAVKSILTVYTF